MENRINDRAGILIDRMRTEIINAKPAAAKDKIVVDKQVMMTLLDRLTEVVNSELAEYREVTDKRAKIISDAKLLSDKIQYEAQKSASRIRVTKRRPWETPPFRVAELDDDEKAALRTANDIYAASLIYTDEMLTEVDHLVNDAYGKIELEYRRVLDTLKNKIEEVSNSKAELMSNLEDLSKMDRYSQIMELGSLLSQELYNEKQNAEAEERVRMQQLSIEFDDNMNIVEQTEPNDIINPDRTGYKVNSQTEKEPVIKVMDRSAEAVGRKDSE
jgi:hypothetical protein